MPKLPVISGKELITALKKAGFVEVRTLQPAKMIFQIPNSAK